VRKTPAEFSEFLREYYEGLWLMTIQGFDVGYTNQQMEAIFYLLSLLTLLIGDGHDIR
jgi:hypothetical protein